MSTAKREHRLPCRAMLGLTQSQLKQRQDPNGSNCLKIEGTTSQPWSEGYKGVHEARSNLPAWQELDLFLNAFKESQVIIVDSPTGSGKSTQIPQACAHALDHAGCTGQVLVTQPRRIPTMECGKRLGVEMDLKVGVALGIEMRGEVIMPDDRQDARIITMTDGLLSNKIAGDPDLKNVAVVIIDEVHERGVNMDLALGLLKIILGRRSDLRVVCMSATGENSTLLTHFEAFAPLLVKLSGQAKKIHRTFLKHVEVDWERCAHQAVQQILRDRQHSLPKGDILIFCPGEREIFQLRERVQEIKDSYPAECQHVDIFTLFRDLPRVEQAKVLEDKFDPILWTDGTQRKVLRRKVILATNIAETSITFPHLDYVVDCGENKQAGFIPKYNANELLLAPCSKAQIIQRVGRVGRIRQGYAICLYTEDIYKTLPDFPQPPILRTDMTATIMKLLFVGLPTGGLGTFPWPSKSSRVVWQLTRKAKPHPAQVIRAVDTLQALGFVKHDTLALTDQGKVAAQLNLNPQLAKLFLEGIGSGVEGDLLVLVAMLEGSNIQKVGVDDKEEATSFYKTFVHERGDHFTLVNLWKAWKAHQQMNHGPHFAQKFYIHGQNCGAVDHRINEINDLWTKLGGTRIVPTTQDSVQGYEAKFGKSLLRGFAHNLAVRVDVPLAKGKAREKDVRYEWRNIHECAKGFKGKALQKSHTSMLGKEHNPRYIIYTSLDYQSSTDSLVMHHATDIDEAWIREWDPEFLTDTLI